MKIYTKTGDQGETGLLGGTRVPKHHIRIQAYGALDELNSHLGFLRSMIDSDSHFIDQLQSDIFDIGSHLALDPSLSKSIQLPELPAFRIGEFEQEIDRMEDNLPSLKNFILPAGSAVVCQAHIARTVCRRAERNVSELDSVSKVDAVCIAYLNRLSDYLFVLARYLHFCEGKKDIYWAPKAKK
ncbi:MAG TPA: cob(I)yrinic acid a,c-diamide adenosyltransferase [Saprospiraceae bacterium]|nr:cob(I)yrinic acid a,c-diamide adenosyltransferase [Saprospiraceae bacterium]